MSTNDNLDKPDEPSGLVSGGLPMLGILQRFQHVPDHFKWWHVIIFIIILIVLVITGFDATWYTWLLFIGVTFVGMAAMWAFNQPMPRHSFMPVQGMRQPVMRSQTAPPRIQNQDQQMWQQPQQQMWQQPQMQPQFQQMQQQMQPQMS